MKSSLIRRSLDSIRRFFGKLHHLLFVYAPHHNLIEARLNENDAILDQLSLMLRTGDLDAERWERLMTKVDQNTAEVEQYLYTSEELHDRQIGNRH